MAGEETKKIILAVDDMPVNLAALRTILQNDFDLRLAKSAHTALTMLNVIRVDLILLDIEMPEMSGFDFLERIRNNGEHPEFRDIPVIFVTSHVSPDFITRAITGGAKAYITRPVVPADLLRKITAALETAGEISRTS
ncbi:MAG: response regulator [Spirochaetaceae bacterium]|nr:response regulator [Spirochaetaceae bacterium]